ncbi:MAG: hypothetical protein BroJett025_09550 [Patescibacteria group bacterium]|nr:MAG: hypothetical protein BroJett025_09550 [Patescibacteria group bacterium]
MILRAEQSPQTKVKKTLSDRIIEWQVKYLQRNRQPPEQFTKNVTLTRPDKGESDIPTLEQDLAVVQEARNETAAAREAGLLVSKEINPFGDDLQELVMFAFGDVHQLGSNPENSIYHRNKFPYKYIEALAFQPKKHLVESMIIGFLGRDYKALVEEINTKKGIKSFAKNKLLGRLGEERVVALMEEHEDWSLEKKPKMQVDALRVTMGSILQG